ncbi:HDOD domain-containing protein [Marinobacter sp. C2H3]|uniref:HDOD domain-containing protein n=1 Tax=Marinobacter sp. C2H3 TaxID=3119003 RepID=UPI00300F2E70
MPGLFAWVSKQFGRKSQASSAPETRLLNPMNASASGPESLHTDLAEQLENHLFSWLLDTTPTALSDPAAGTDPALGLLDQRLLNGQLEELPRQPMTLPMLMRALSDDNTGRQTMAEIILQDPALTDQLLQMANSPFFRHGDHRIESVDQAVFLLGMNGIRNVIAAAIMRPMMSARNSREALFAQRCWRWGLACGKAAELIARYRGEDTSAHFLVGLMPALAYMTLRRELLRITRTAGATTEPEPAVVRVAIARHQWHLCQLLAAEWNLPPRYHAMLLAAERPSPKQTHAPLVDGMVMASREVLRVAHQRNLGEEDMARLIQLSPEQISQVRSALKQMLQSGPAS